MIDFDDLTPWETNMLYTLLEHSRLAGWVYLSEIRSERLAASGVLEYLDGRASSFNFFSHREQDVVRRVRLTKAGRAYAEQFEVWHALVLDGDLGRRLALGRRGR